MRKPLALLAIALLLLCVALGALWVGQYPITLEEYALALKSSVGLASASSESVEAVKHILWEIRLPRILAAILIGAALAVSGAAFQGLFVNPLVSPGVLGVLQGASFGAALGMLFHQSLFIIQISAFGFGFLSVGVALFISRVYGQNRSLLMLVLGGMISASFFGALLSLVKYVADPNNSLPAIVYWLMGSLANSHMDGVLAVALPMGFSIGVLMWLGKYLNLMSLGEEEALSMGVEVAKVRLGVIILGTILGSLSVMLAGAVGWVGLVIPHIARLMIGADHTYLIPFSALLGGVFLLLVDSVARAAMSVEIPLGILTALVGIPVFLSVLHNSFRNR